MSTLISQWLPILLSAVAVFIVSSIVHTVIRWHRNDQSTLPNEDAVADILRGVPVGDYRLPFTSDAAEMKSPAFREKLKRGPIAIVTIMHGDVMAMFRTSLIQWFVYALVVSGLAGHIAGTTLGANASNTVVFHTVFVAAFLGYGMGIAQQPIWGGKPWLPAIKAMVDAGVYAAVTAAIFCWLWPK